MPAANKSPTSEKFRIYGRGAFLRLDKPKKFDEHGEDRWEATALLDPASPKGLEGIKLVIKNASIVSKEAYNGVVPLALRKLAAQFIPGASAPDPKAKDDGIEVAFYDGDVKEYDGFAGMFVVPMHNSKMKPAIANRKGVSVDPGEEQFPYSGSYDYFSLTIWAQVGETQKKYGKRLGVNLRGVQFAADGEAFGQGDIAAEEEFAALEDEGEGAGDGDDLGFD